MDNQLDVQKDADAEKTGDKGPNKELNNHLFVKKTHDPQKNQRRQQRNKNATFGGEFRRGPKRKDCQRRENDDTQTGDKKNLDRLLEMKKNLKAKKAKKELEMQKRQKAYVK